MLFCDVFSVVHISKNGYHGKRSSVLVCQRLTLIRLDSLILKDLLIHFKSMRQVIMIHRSTLFPASRRLMFHQLSLRESNRQQAKFLCFLPRFCMIRWRNRLTGRSNELGRPFWRFLKSDLLRKDWKVGSVIHSQTISERRGYKRWSTAYFLTEMSVLPIWTLVILS